MSAGVDVGEISQSLYETYPLRRIHVLRELLQEMQVTCEERVASWKLKRSVIEELGVEPSRSVVVEDALSGVQAGRAGNFGLVLGVSRGDNRDLLLEAGADIVVDDLGVMMASSG